MEYKIQNIVFPTEQKHIECCELFFRGNDNVIDFSERITLNKSQKVDFTTYLNGCSYGKWKHYASVKNLKLYLELEGFCQVNYVGYTLLEGKLCRLDYGVLNHNSSGRDTVSFTYPEKDNDVLINGFELAAENACTLYWGYYTVEVEESKLNNVELSIVTTTFHKEDFIKKNVELIKKAVMNSSEKLSGHIYFHVVDNGKTLTNEDVFGDHIILHYNRNTGGAGGFTRGIIESLHQKPEITHVLLMDDDVLVLAESIKRTYCLLNTLKNEFLDYFVSGAMLLYEIPYLQYADVLSSKRNKLLLKPSLDLRKISCIADNERDYLSNGDEFAPWWYCVIPINKIKKNGLPLPLFIHYDDSEYSLRNKAKFITMNSICIWHMDVTRKYTESLIEYHDFRNLLIVKATSNVFKEIKVKEDVFQRYRKHILNYNYNAAEALLSGIQDYISGYKFIVNNDPEIIMKIRSAEFNNQFKPLMYYKNINYDLLFKDSQRCFIKKVLYRLTWNGHILWPYIFLNNKPVAIPYNAVYQPGKISFRRYHLLVNPYDKTGKMLEIDKKRFRSLMKRYIKMRIYYFFNKERIVKEYKNAQEELTSELFWRKYLRLEQAEKET